MSKIIGIDLGTTNSCVAIMDGKTPKVIENAEGDFVIGQTGERGNFFGRQSGKFVRKIKAAVGRLSIKQGVAQVDCGRLPVC